jgi:hypothetical protein
MCYSRPSLKGFERGRQSWPIGTLKTDRFDVASTTDRASSLKREGSLLLRVWLRLLSLTINSQLVQLPLTHSLNKQLDRAGRQTQHQRATQRWDGLP